MNFKNNKLMFLYHTMRHVNTVETLKISKIEKIAMVLLYKVKIMRAK
jgi:hypothetical protein